MELNEKQPKVSVIVPIYNVEQYIEKCVRSLMEQTLEDIEFIFVNDCTPDDSMTVLRRILKEYPARVPQVKIVELKENNGSAAARITGVNTARGEYIIHCDSDDWVEHTIYECMYALAKEQDADMVWCDYYCEDVDNSEVISLRFSCDSIAYVKGIMTMKIPGFLWNKLYRRELCKRFRNEWTKGADMWEDVSVTIPMTHYAKNIAYIEAPLYHYRKANVHSIMRNNSQEKKVKRVWDIMRNVENVTSFVERENLIGVYTPELYELQLSVKYGLLSADVVALKEWRNIFPKSVKYIRKAYQFTSYQKLFLYAALYNWQWVLSMKKMVMALMRELRG